MFKINFSFEKVWVLLTICVLYSLVYYLTPYGNYSKTEENNRGKCRLEERELYHKNQQKNTEYAFPVGDFYNVYYFGKRDKLKNKLDGKYVIITGTVRNVYKNYIYITGKDHADMKVSGLERYETNKIKIGDIVTLGGTVEFCFLSEEIQNAILM